MTEHRYPRRAAQKTKSNPFMGIDYWEQLAPDGDITVHCEGSYPTARSCWDNFDSLLNGTAHCGVVETFDHHFPRYFEERASRGLHHRRKYTSNTHAVWADGVAPENNLCRTYDRRDAAYATLDAALASRVLIEVDANGVALDGSDEHARRINEGFDSYSFEIRKRQARIEQLEAEALAKDTVNDELRGSITRAHVEVGTLRKEIEKLKADKAFAEQSSLYSGRTLTAIRNERDELQKKYENMLHSATSLSNKCDSYEKAEQALRVERDDRKRKYDEVTDDVTKIFYAVGPNPPIVQNFIAKGELYGSAMTRLAHEFVMLRNERDTLRNNAERSQCAGHYATIQYDRLRYAINDIVKFSRRNPSETDLDIITRVFNERDALNKTIQKVKDELK